MADRPLVRRELLWARRHRWTLVAVFLVVPAVAGLATTAFEQAVPRGVPVAVAPAAGAVTGDEMTAVEGVAKGVAKPVRYDSVAAARSALSREQVYGVLVVPHGLYDTGSTVTLRLYVEGSVVPYEPPSRAVAATLDESASAFPASVDVERVVVEPRRTLSEYLFATLPLILFPVYAFTYVPMRLVSERNVLDRVRVESSLTRLVATKVAVFTALAGGVVFALAVVGALLDYRVNLLAPGALVAMGVTFVALVATSTGITVLSGFSAIGRFANVVALVGLLAFSNVFYPAGFFSPLRREVAAWMPLHHAAVVVRATALRGASANAYADALLGLAAVAVLALAWLAATVVITERRA